MTSLKLIDIRVTYIFQLFNWNCTVAEAKDLKLCISTSVSWLSRFRGYAAWNCVLFLHASGNLITCWEQKLVSSRVTKLESTIPGKFRSKASCAIQVCKECSRTIINSIFEVVESSSCFNCSLLFTSSLGILHNLYKAVLREFHQRLDNIFLDEASCLYTQSCKQFSFTFW